MSMGNQSPRTLSRQIAVWLRGRLCPVLLYATALFILNTAFTNCSVAERGMLDYVTGTGNIIQNSLFDSGRTYTVGGTVSGLGGTVTLSLNGSEQLSVNSDGAFAFSAALTDNALYGVTVAVQPNPPYYCTISNGNGVIRKADVTGIRVTCSNVTFKVSGTVQGLAGSGLQLQNNTEILPVTGKGTVNFSFAQPVSQGAVYEVTVKQNPTAPAQSCTVTNGGPAAITGNVTNVIVSCTTNSYRIGGSVSGLTAAGLRLQLNGGCTVDVPSGATAFNFGSGAGCTVTSGGTYTVTRLSQPAPPLLCTVTGGTGTVASADVSSVAVNCSVGSYTVGGSVSGLAGSNFQIQNSSTGQLLNITGNGTYAFPAIADGSAYTISVVTHPGGAPNNIWQTCSIANSTGNLAGANQTNVNISCTTNTYMIGGTITGLNGSGLALQLDGACPITIPAGSATFSFGAGCKVASNTNYTVTKTADPSTPNQLCTLSGTSGTVTSAGVTSVSISCATNQYSIRGSVNGLAGSNFRIKNSVTLQTLDITANGAFSFPAVDDGTLYKILVDVQPNGAPNNIWQSCTVTNGGDGLTTMINGADITNVSINCTTRSFTIGGSVTGLNGVGLTLTLNAGCPISIPNGATTFTFGTGAGCTVLSGGNFTVANAGDPISLSQVCSVSGGSGTMAGANVSSVAVNCTTSKFMIGGTVTGLSGSNLRLKNSVTGQLLDIIANGSYSFPAMDDGTFYGIIVDLQPSGAPNNIWQSCSVTNGGDGSTTKITGADVLNVNITCTTNTYWIGGTFSPSSYGASDVSVTLGQGADSITRARNTWGSAFQFGVKVASGQNYTVTVNSVTPVNAINCTVANPSGTVTNADIANAVVTCKTKWSQVSAGNGHSLAIRGDGTLWAWGLNGDGQLGDGSKTNRLSPVKIGTATWLSASAGSFSHSLGIQSNGTAWSWGRNWNGQLGDGTTTQRLSPTQIGTSTWSALSAGGGHSLGVLSDGTLWAWGQNFKGQLGDGTQTDRGSPVKIGTSTWTKISAGFSHSLAIQSGGTLWAWGFNVYGQLGDGTNTDRLSPVQLSLAGVEGISTGNGHSMAIRNYSTGVFPNLTKHSDVYAWGSNQHHQIGDGTTTDRAAPVLILSTTWTGLLGQGFNIAAGGYFGAQSNGFSLAYIPYALLSSGGPLNAWGFNGDGQLGDGTTTEITAPSQIGTASWIQVTAGALHSLGIKPDGTLWAWGANGSGELGLGNTTAAFAPTEVTGP